MLPMTLRTGAAVVAVGFAVRDERHRDGQR